MIWRNRTGLLPTSWCAARQVVEKRILQQRKTRLVAGLVSGCGRRGRHRRWLAPSGHRRPSHRSFSDSMERMISRRCPGRFIRRRPVESAGTGRRPRALELVMAAGCASDRRSVKLDCPMTCRRRAAHGHGAGLGALPHLAAGLTGQPWPLTHSDEPCCALWHASTVRKHVHFTSRDGSGDARHCRPECGAALLRLVSLLCCRNAVDVLMA